LAEDEILLGEIIKESLESRGFELVHVSCGKKAIEAFKTFSPDIVNVFSTFSSLLRRNPARV
jgi:DNA-binding response OmpR family regulator